MGLFDWFTNKEPETLEEAESDFNDLTNEVVKKQNEDKKEEVDKSGWGGLFK